jgi:hypothetical protein
MMPKPPPLNESRRYSRMAGFAAHDTDIADVTEELAHFGATARLGPKGVGYVRPDLP